MYLQDAEVYLGVEEEVVVPVFPAGAVVSAAEVVPEEEVALSSGEVRVVNLSEHSLLSQASYIYFKRNLKRGA